MLALILLHIYFVSFLDKPEKTAPQLSERAWQQRAQWNIPTDQMDYPVCAAYQSKLREMGVKIHHKSRWFNGVTCEMDEKTATKVKELQFVTNVEMTRMDKDTSKGMPERKAKWLNEIQSEIAINYTDTQLSCFNLPILHEAGFEGQGILMAVCDGGFQNVNSLNCFRSKEMELGHFDFTDDKEDFYSETGRHGTMCLSTITAINESYYGAAVKAKYYLIRSEEYHTESPKEMDNLVAALEVADSLGVNVFSVSLGYAQFDEDTLDHSALDGRSTRASIAATIAARKGMLVCAAAGNEGAKTWQSISVPADADSILTVGAVTSDSIIASFSSYGPSADGRIKPEVCAVGVKSALIVPDGTVSYAGGTSFSTPLVAGLAASLWSALPDENAMQIRQRIIRSADRFYHPDKQRYGYGIPDAWKAYTMKQEDLLSNNETVQPSILTAHKMLRRGHIYIIRQGQTYNLSGQRVE